VSAAPWYAAGLRFACRRCGACCTGEPGNVWIDAAETRALAAALGLDPREFLALHARRVDGAWSLREEADGRCVLFEPGRGCRAYADRPVQCRTWPFWARVVASRGAWRREAAGCPGMDSGELVDAAEIERRVRLRAGR
jgi:Fe-S-cluster containining protein